MLCNLITILVNILGVFPAGSLPMSDRQLIDDHGDITWTSIINYYFGSNELSFDVPILSNLLHQSITITVSWALFLTALTVTIIIVAAITHSAGSVFAIGVMAIIMYSMFVTSYKWFNNLIRNAGGVAYPSIIFLGTLIAFGIIYVFVITILESHTQGDVSDK